MIDNLWKCFETTGGVNAYLDFKAYEKLKNEQRSTHFLEKSSKENVVTDKA